MKKKIILILLPFLLVEGLLRLGGFFYTWRQSLEIKKQMEAVGEGGIRVLCLGDSNTYGLEAHFDNSYPRHLERLLQGNHTGQKILVSNWGQPGFNSAQALSKLKIALPRFNPQYVVVLVGVNNRWNMEERDVLLDRRLQISVRGIPLLNNLRLVKAVGVVVANSRSRGMGQEQGPPRPEEASGPTAFQKEAYEIRKKMFSNRLEEALKKALVLEQTYTDVPEAYALLGKIYARMDRTQKALVHYDKALALSPGNTGYLMEQASVYAQQNKWEEAESLLVAAYEGDPTNPTVQGMLRHNRLTRTGELFFSEEELLLLDRWLREDLREMALLCQKYGKRMILLNYPRTTFQDPIRRSVAEEYGLPFVDLHAFFSGLENEESYYGPSGGHPNDEGYGLMAQRVYGVLKGFIQ